MNVSAPPANVAHSLQTDTMGDGASSVVSVWASWRHNAGVPHLPSVCWLGPGGDRLVNISPDQPGWLCCPPPRHCPAAGRVRMKHSDYPRHTRSRPSYVLLCYATSLPGDVSISNTELRAVVDKSLFIFFYSLYPPSHQFPITNQSRAGSIIVMVRPPY